MSNVPAYLLFVLTIMNTTMISIMQVNNGPIRLRRRPKNALPELPKADCQGCGHSLSYHDPDTHSCHEQVQGAPIKYNPLSTAVLAYGLRQCTCRQYVGHLPADQMIATFNPHPTPRGDQSRANRQEGQAP